MDSVLLQMHSWGEVDMGGISPLPHYNTEFQVSRELPYKSKAVEPISNANGHLTISS